MAKLIQIPGLTEGTNKSYFVKKQKTKQNQTKKPQQKPTLILDTKNYLKLISSKCSSFFYWQYIWYVWWTCFPIDSRYTYVYKLCSSCHRLIPIFVRDSLHTWASQELACSFNSKFRHIDDVLSLNNYKVGDFVDSMDLTELRIKDTTDTVW